MNRTKVCKLLGSIHEFIEDCDAKELEKATIGKKLLYISDDIANTFLIDNHNAPSGLVHKEDQPKKETSPTDSATESTEKDPIEKEEKSFEELLEDAYKVLRTETRQGPTVVKRELGVTMAKARKLVKELFDSGRLVKGVRAADTDGLDEDDSQDEIVQQSDDDFGSIESDDDFDDEPISKSKPKSLSELIDSLPKGDNLLVRDSVKLLMSLPEPNRKPYLSGLKLEDMVTVESVEAGSIDGVDRTLIDIIIDNTKVKPKVVGDRLNLGDKNSEQMVKYARLRALWVKGIPNGKELYDLMARNGVNKRVLGDLRQIYQAVESGAV